LARGSSCFSDALRDFAGDALPDELAEPELLEELEDRDDDPLLDDDLDLLPDELSEPLPTFTKIANRLKYGERR